LFPLHLFIYILHLTAGFDLWETSLGLATPRSMTIHAGRRAQLIDRKIPTFIPYLDRSIVSRTFERLSGSVERLRDDREIVDCDLNPPVSLSIATRGWGDPCFCIALRGICISV